jgi:hypothetical protein
MINIPTLKELYDSIVADIEAEFGTSIPTVGKNFLRVFAGVQAAKLKLYYLAIGKIQKNIFIDTAEPEATGGTLERFGRVKLGRNPFQPTAGQYTVSITGSIGAVIPASQTFKSNDNSLSPSKLFVLDTAYTLVSTTDTITVRALESGIGAKLESGDMLTATSPIIGVNSSVTVQTETIQPLDGETLEDYRRKALESFRLEPQGGAATDYRLWAADAQGVAQSYPYATSGAPNEIDLYIEATIADSTDSKGTPSAGMLLAVEDVIELDPDTTLDISERGRRPLGVFQVHYLPVTPLDVEITINGAGSISADNRDLINGAIDAEVKKIRPFVAGADILANKNDIISVYKIVAIVLDAYPQAQFTTIDLVVDGVNVSTFTFEFGDIPYLDSITYA